MQGRPRTPRQPGPQLTANPRAAHRADAYRATPGRASRTAKASQASRPSTQQRNDQRPSQDAARDATGGRESQPPPATHRTSRHIGGLGPGNVTSETSRGLRLINTLALHGAPWGIARQYRRASIRNPGAPKRNTPTPGQRPPPTPGGKNHTTAHSA